MVTKKTRLLSAIAVVAMLVSMLTCFVIPAAAAEDYAMPEAPENLIAYKDRTTDTDVAGDNGMINYAITDAEDWVKLAEDTNAAKGGGTFGSGRHYFNGWAFWFTDDLDFTEYSGTYNGSAVATDFITRQLFLCTYYKASAAIADQGFRGQIYGQGHKITNLNVDITAQVTNGNYSYMALIACGYDALVRDLTVDSSCSFKYTVGGMAKEWQTGVFGGHCDAMTYINCRNEASVEINDLVTDEAAGTITSGKNNSTSAFGRQTGALTMINCSNAGAITNNDQTRATGLAEWIGSAATIYNSYNVGKLTTNYSTPKAYTGAVSSSVSSGLAADIQNCYNLGEDFASGTRSTTELDTMGTAISEAEYAAGKMAYLLNANYAENDYGKFYYTMEDGEMVKGTAENQTVGVRFIFDGEEKALGYVDIGEALDMNGVDHGITDATYATTDTAATVSGSTIVVNTAPAAADLIVDVEITTATVQFDELNETLAYYVGRNTDWYVNAEGETLTATYEDIVANMAGYTQDQVNAAVDTLKGFSFLNNGADVFEADSAEDFAAIATDVALFDVEDIIYITKDIDFGGSAEANTVKIPGLKASLIGKKDGVEDAAVKLSNIYVDTSWLGNFYGETLANIVFEDCTAAAVANPGAIVIANVYGKYEHTFKNITMINCESIKTAKSNTMGLLVGRNYQGTKFTYQNILIEGSSMSDVSGRTDGNVNMGFVVANAYSAAPTIMENVYLKGNTFYSDYIDTANGVITGEISSTGSEFKNIAVLDTEIIYNNVSSSLTVPENTLGAIGLYKDGTEITLNNIIYAGTTVAKAAESTCETDLVVPSVISVYADSAAAINASNIYTDAAAVVVAPETATVTEINAYANAGEAVASGKAAAELNIAGVEQLWTMNGTTPEYGTEANKTVKIIAVNYGEEIGAAYVNVGEVVDVAELAAAYTSACTYAINEGEIVDGKITAFAPTNEDKMIIVTIVPTEVEASLVADVEAAKADIDAFLATYAEVLEFFVEKDTIETLADSLAEALALVDGEDIDAATAALNEALVVYNALTYEVKGNVPYKYNTLEKFAGVKTWAIGDEADWRAAVAKGAYSFEGETLTLTADIDMTADGDNSVVLPLSYANTDEFSGFAGTLNGDGHVFKNILVETTPEIDGYHTGLVGRIAGTGVVMDLGIESGEIKVTWGVIDIDGGSNAMAVGGIAGSAASGSKILRCWNAADVKVVATDLIVNDTLLEKAVLDEEGNPQLEMDVSIGGIVGRGLTGSLMDGCYNVGTVTGLLHASGLNDWGQGTGAVYNSYDASTLIVDEEAGYGQAVRYNTTSPKKEIIINSYAVGHRFSRVATDYKANTIENANLLPVVASSGELAYLLNANATDMGNGLTYYKVENGKTVYATEADRTFRITLKDAEGNILYAYANGGTELTIGGETIVVTADTEVTVENAAHEHETEVYDLFFDGKDYVWSHQTRCDYATEIDGVAAYCTHADDVQEACTTEYRYVEDSADETHAHLADQFCTVCGGTRHGRSHAATNFNSEVTTAATVDEEGLMTYTCKTCPYTYTEVIEKVKGFALNTTIDETTGTAVVDVVLKNNPGVAGMTLNVTFDAANLEIVEVVAGELDFYINTDPFYTENEDGTVTATFSVASGEDVVEDGVVATLNFNILNKVGEVTFAVTAADVVKADSTELTLEGATGTATLHEHAYEETITEATCTAPGKKTYTCSCGDSYEEVIEQLAHTEEILPAKDATCTETGLTEGKKCSVCGEILVAQEEIALAGHTEEILPAKDATCTEAGLTEGKKCSVCGEILVAQEEIAASGHGTLAIADGYVVCSLCGEVDKTVTGVHYIVDNNYLVNEGKLVHGEYGIWSNGSEFYFINGRPATAGVHEVDGEEIYITSERKLADGVVYVSGEANLEALGVASAGNYAFKDGKLIDGDMAVWTNGQEYLMTMGKPSMGGAFDYKGQVVYIRSDGIFADGGWNVTNEEACEKLGIEPGRGYLFDNGVLVHGRQGTWVNGHDYYMDMGRPFNTGVSYIDGVPHYIVMYDFCSGIWPLSGDKAYVAEALGVEAGKSYLFEGGRLVDGKVASWNGTNYLIVMGRPTGAPIT